MEGYNDLSKEELLDVLREYVDGPHSKIYEVGVKKIKELSEQFLDTRIDVKSEDGDKAFNNFTKFMSSAPKWSIDLEEIQKRIDPQVALRIRREAETANDLSVEGMAKARKNGKL